MALRFCFVLFYFFNFPHACVTWFVWHNTANQDIILQQVEPISFTYCLLTAWPLFQRYLYHWGGKFLHQKSVSRGNQLSSSSWQRIIIHSSSWRCLQEGYSWGNFGLLKLVTCHNPYSNWPSSQLLVWQESKCFKVCLWWPWLGLLL